MNRNTIDDLEDYFDRLWPLFRSITGDGVRETHKILSEILPLNTFEVPTGTEVFDWHIPKEWVVKEAYVIDPEGKKILNIQDNNLHLVNYSIPFKGTVTKEELQQHLYSKIDLPDAIPYVTSYYKERWGFCISENERNELKDGDYYVYIDTALIDGSLTISDCILKGDSDDEVLISTYTCHPSLANNELSGPLVAAFLYRELCKLKRRRLTYRFVFIPETIGSIAYLSLKGKEFTQKTVGGYVITCVGNKNHFTYKRSRKGNSPADKAVEYVLDSLNETIRVDDTYDEYRKQFNDTNHNRILNFFPDNGSDERQYCSPGFDLPVGSLMRSMYGIYKEYHTSLDNKNYISFDAMKESIDVYLKVLEILEKNRIYKNKIMYCEPQLGKRDLYPDINVGGSLKAEEFVNATKWLLNLADGENDLLSIARKSHIKFEVLEGVARKCLEKEVIELIE